MTGQVTELNLITDTDDRDAEQYLTVDATQNWTALGNKFDHAAGHKHTGAVGDGPPLTTASLAAGAATGTALGADVATLAGAQTLTNKTLAGGTVYSQPVNNLTTAINDQTGGSVAITPVGTWVDTGCTFALGAGAWLVYSVHHIANSGGTTSDCLTRIVQGTGEVRRSLFPQVPTGGTSGAIYCVARIVNTGATTIKTQANLLASTGSMHNVYENVLWAVQIAP